MNQTVGLSLPEQQVSERSAADSTRAARERLPDDMDLIRLAAKLTRDLNAPSPAMYWTDFLLSSALGYGALAFAIFAQPLWLTIIAGIVAVFALYRAGSFIHELTHIKHELVPGFRFGWNAIIGVPMLIPSFMYEGVHNLHHARTRYGTALDPEYLPLAHMKWWSVPFFVAIAALAPIAQLVRFAVLTPLSTVIPPLRRWLIADLSGLKINPAFQRRAPEGAEARRWLWQETACSLWSIALLGLLIAGVIPVRAFAIYLIVAAAVLVINQVRTLVAHLWENDGEEMTVTAQYLDSVNVPPPGSLPALWAPVGLRYHGLHHLLPGLPYHSLGEAHRRLIEAMPELDATYHRSNHRGLTPLVVRLVRGAGK